MLHGGLNEIFIYVKLAQVVGRPMLFIRHNVYCNLETKPKE